MDPEQLLISHLEIKHFKSVLGVITVDLAKRNGHLLALVGENGTGVTTPAKPI
jgi:ABC-type Na+ transport system ATPase subunit NatA